MQDKNCQGRGQWHGKFHGCGCRMTAGRETVIRVLQETSKHLSADEIFIRARKINPDIGLTTVYRTLEKLSTMGEVHRLDSGDKRGRFELADSEKGHHHHLVCTMCNSIIDYDDFIDEEIKLLKETEKKLSQKYNFNINSHLIQFYGICEKCK
ncbi:MAG: transcriptional repressor [Spirochaetia bacterium]|nr:transcriptional repressor [Spirochaetia bacterium]